jgi:hypothetical protein
MQRYRGLILKSNGKIINHAICINMKLIISLSLLLVFENNCNFLKKKDCFKEFINNHKFSFGNKIVDPNGYLIFKDSLLYEFSDDTLRMLNRITWTSCSEYFLVTKTQEGIWKVGDTMIVNILSKKKDTVKVLASAKGAAMIFSIYKDD